MTAAALLLAGLSARASEDVERTAPADPKGQVEIVTVAGEVHVRGWDRPEVRYHLFFPRALARLRFAEKYLRWFPLGAQYSVRARKP